MSDLTINSQPRRVDHLPAGSSYSCRLLTQTEAHTSASAYVSYRLLTLTAPSSEDEPILYRTYASTRLEEMALTGWDAQQQELFLRMQYEAQRQSYRIQVPDAEYWVIRLDGVPAGRLITNRTNQEIHIVDIAVLPEFRNQRIASTLMTSLLDEAAQTLKKLSLHVERFNPALSWYRRLGFNVVSSGPIYHEMVWQPISSPSAGQPSNQANGDHGVHPSD